MTHTINLNHITKIEGHANLHVVIENDQIKECKLSSIEGSRYFEGLLKGKHFFEAHEITSRICGVCSCAHTVAAVTAMENAFGIEITHQSKELRKLITLGERIRSHAAHLYFLALPDYLGYESAIAMLPKYRTEVTRALRLMKLGNEIVKAVGGRDLHPVSVTVGGFLKIPESLTNLIEPLKERKADAIDTAKLFGDMTLPELEDEHEFFSLYDESEFPMLQGAIVSEKSRFEQKDYLKYFKEYHVPYSTANFVVRDDKSYLVGAIARINNSHAKLSNDTKYAMHDAKIRLPSKNPFANNFCQALELIHCIDHALDICRNLDLKYEKPIVPLLKECRGVAAIEVPRGILFHDYTIDEKGIIEHANIITPTAQNLKNMEDMIRQFLPVAMKQKTEEKINLEIEKLIRSFDPCFSCSTHFLNVKWEHR